MSTIKRLQSIVLALCCSLGCSMLLAADDESRLQGVWFGDGQHPLSRNVLIVDGDKFTIISPLGAFVSSFRSNEAGTLSEIDIDRFDGERQLGVLELSETQLRLKLSQPNQARPTLKDVRLPNGEPHWHTVFRRRPTQEGLEVLAKHSEKLPEGQN